MAFTQNILVDITKLDQNKFIKKVMKD